MVETTTATARPLVRKPLAGGTLIFVVLLPAVCGFLRAQTSNRGVLQIQKEFEPPPERPAVVRFRVSDRHQGPVATLQEGEVVALPEGVYQIEEVGRTPGYVPIYGGDCPRGEVEVAAGVLHRCEVTNVEITGQPTGDAILRVAKEFFPEAAEGGGGSFGVFDANDRKVGEIHSQQALALAPGVYRLEELFGSPQYVATFSFPCEGGKVTLTAGILHDCTVVNVRVDDEPTGNAVLYLEKEFLPAPPELGGEPRFAVLDDEGNSAGEISPPGGLALAPGEYRLIEQRPSSLYLPTYDSGCPEGRVTLVSGSLTSCLVTNVRAESGGSAVLEITKRYVPGPPESRTSVELEIWTDPESTDSVKSAELVATVENEGAVALPPGEYRIRERLPPDGYVPTFDDDCFRGRVVLQAGVRRHCAVTNVRVHGIVDTGPAPSAVLDLTKRFVPAAPEGLQRPVSFDVLDAEGRSVATVDEGKPSALPAGEYRLVEARPVNGYAATFLGDCAGRRVALFEGTLSRCQITNLRIDEDYSDPGGSAVIQIVKQFVPERPTSVPKPLLFDLFGGPQGLGATVPEGAPVAVLPGDYRVREREGTLGGHTPTFLDDCFGGRIELKDGVLSRCRIVNIDAERAGPGAPRPLRPRDSNGEPPGAAARRDPTSPPGPPTRGILRVSKIFDPPLSEPLGRVRFELFEVVKGVDAELEYRVSEVEDDAPLLLPPGTYRIKEPELPMGYVATFDFEECRQGEVMMRAGVLTTCTVTNVQVEGQGEGNAVLQLEKSFLPELEESGSRPRFAVFAERDGGTSEKVSEVEAPGTYALAPGIYRLEELTQTPGYVPAYSGVNGRVVLESGMFLTYKITNVRVDAAVEVEGDGDSPRTALLQINKEFVPERPEHLDGVPVFFVLVGDEREIVGRNLRERSPAALPPGTYQIRETGQVEGHVPTFSPSCAGGEVELFPGVLTECTITNVKATPSGSAILEISKVWEPEAPERLDPVTIEVVDERDRVVAKIEGSGSGTLALPPSGDEGLYRIREPVVPEGYMPVFVGDCFGGAVRLVAGDRHDCQIQNLRIAQDVGLDDGGGGSEPLRKGALQIQKVFDPHQPEGFFRAVDFELRTPRGDEPDSDRFVATIGQGDWVALPPGRYRITEAGQVPDHVAVFETACADGMVEVLEAFPTVCRVTNVEVDPRTHGTAVLEITKEFLPAPPRGLRRPLRFSVLNERGQGVATVFEGQAAALPPGSYRLREPDFGEGYLATYGEGCPAGAFTLKTGDRLRCKVTNVQVEEEGGRRPP